MFLLVFSCGFLYDSYMEHDLRLFLVFLLCFCFRTRMARSYDNNHGCCSFFTNYGCYWLSTYYMSGSVFYIYPGSSYQVVLVSTLSRNRHWGSRITNSDTKIDLSCVQWDELWPLLAGCPCPASSSLSLIPYMESLLGLSHRAGEGIKELRVMERSGPL